MRRAVPVTVLALALAGGCGSAPAPVAPSEAPSEASTEVSASPTGPALRAPTPTQPSARPTSTSDLVVAVPEPTPQAQTVTPGGTTSAADRLTSLRGDTRSAIYWAPLSNPSAVSSEGSVPSVRAWSTSKVLVVAAYLDTVVDGDPSKVPSRERGWIRAALTRSDGDAVVAIRNQIPGSPGNAITSVLRSIGDSSTVAPDRSQGAMAWSPREQVRFMAALSAGRVVSPAASRYLLGEMNPIPQHEWGLGTIGAGPFKGGWLTGRSETRQMGIVGGYAVAIITVGVGPAVVQTDGDAAHVWQMNRLADLLARRIS